MGFLNFRLTIVNGKSSAWHVLRRHNLYGRPFPRRALASLAANTMGFTAVGFNSPPDRLVTESLSLNTNSENIYHFGSGADPIFLGQCNAVRPFITWQNWRDRETSPWQLARLMISPLRPHVTLERSASSTVQSRFPIPLSLFTESRIWSNNSRMKKLPSPPASPKSVPNPIARTGNLFPEVTSGIGSLRSYCACWRCSCWGIAAGVGDGINACSAGQVLVLQRSNLSLCSISARDQNLHWVPEHFLLPLPPPERFERIWI